MKTNDRRDVIPPMPSGDAWRHLRVRLARQDLPDADLLLAGIDAVLVRQEWRLPTAVAWGLYNAGKSTMLNALCDQFDPEFFPSGAVPLTRSRAQFDHDGIRFIDTPGIDVAKADDQAAFAEIMTADLHMLVHHLGSGELDRLETDLLVRLNAGSAVGSDFANRLIVVISHLDGIGAGELEPLQAKIGAQLVGLLGRAPVMAAVSATRYRQGTVRDKAVLVTRSNIPQLRRLISDMAAVSFAARRQRMSTGLWTAIQHLSAGLAARIAGHSTQLARLDTKIQSSSGAVRNHLWAALNDAHRVLGDLDRQRGLR